MTNFRINFERPWFLLLLIPALVLTLLPYFRLAKKYRRTRNRVVSIVLHTLIMALSISVLSGITFQYDLPNVENEVILLVDTSFSGSDEEAAKNEFIEEVVNSNDGSFKLGIVTFGYNQVYASELTENKKDVFAKISCGRASRRYGDGYRIRAELRKHAVLQARDRTYRGDLGRYPDGRQHRFDDQAAGSHRHQGGHGLLPER